MFGKRTLYVFYTFSIILLMYYKGYAQTSDKKIAKQFRTLIDEKSSYAENLLKIQKFIQDSLSDHKEVALSLWYNELSKFNHQNTDYDNAIANQKKAITIQKRLIDSFPFLLNKSYNNLAYFNLYQGDESSALDAFKALIELPFKDKYTIRAYAIGITDLLTKRGDYFKLREYLFEAEQMILKSDNEELTRDLYRIYLSLSRVHLDINESNSLYKAIEFLKKVELSTDDLSDEIKILIQNQYGIIYNRLGNLSKSIVHYEKALHLSLLKKPPNKNNISLIYNNLGVVHTHIGNTKKAYELYKKAIEYDMFKSMVYDNLGDYYLNQEDFEQALLHYQKAIDFNIEQYDHHDYKNLQDIEVLATASDRIGLVNDLKDKANAWLRYHQKVPNKEYLQKALITVTRADQLIDMIRSESTEQQSRFFWRKKGVDLYLLATRICYSLQQPEQAFYFMEKSKSLSLLENLTHEEAKKRGGLPEELQEKEYTLRREIFEASQAFVDDITMTRDNRRSLVFTKKRAYEDFLTSLENEYPAYYNFKKQIDVVSYADCFQNLVNPQTAVVQYILSDDEGYGIYMSQKSTRFFKIPDVQKLQNEIIEARKLLQKPFFSAQDQKSYQELSFSIFQKLFPFMEDVQSIFDQKIIIIPDHTLQTFPFEALWVKNTLESPEKSYFMNFCEISYLYSSSLHQQIIKKRRSAINDFLGFAPVSYTDTTLSTLRRSKEKIEKIGVLFSGQHYLSQQASKEKFLQESNNYGIIHLSTHANSMTNEMPWIAFYNDKLFLNELYFVKNQADLVVLDACQTGIGELQPGEGVMSLTRGFFHSGAKSVISSLWSTNEKASNEIIQNFYEYLKNGLTKSAALRKSKLAYLNSHQGSEISPYFWAPLVLTGDMGNVALQNSNSSRTWSLWMFAVGTTIIVGFIIYRNLQKKHRTT